MHVPPTYESHGPSAPPANMFDVLPGYEGTIAGGGGIQTHLSLYTFPKCAQFIYLVHK